MERFVRYHPVTVTSTHCQRERICWCVSDEITGVGLCGEERVLSEDRLDSVVRYTSFTVSMVFTWVHALQVVIHRDPIGQYGQHGTRNNSVPYTRSVTLGSQEINYLKPNLV
jgi:hypothetical protein